jgi:hypothetical protein
MPGSLRELDGKKVGMIGFQMALYEFDDIREFHLVANHWSCCFGVPPGLDGSVHVRLAEGEAGLPNTKKPLRVIGTLRIGEMEEGGFVYAIYRIEDAKAEILDW